MSRSVYIQPRLIIVNVSTFQEIQELLQRYIRHDAPDIHRFPTMPMVVGKSVNIRAILRKFSM